jgi:hypothetical protein
VKRAAEMPSRAALAAPAGDGDGGGAALTQIAEMQERIRRQGELLEALHNQTAGQAPRNPAKEALTHTTSPQKKKGRRKKKRGGAGAGMVATPADARAGAQGEPVTVGGAWDGVGEDLREPGSGSTISSDGSGASGVGAGQGGFGVRTASSAEQQLQEQQRLWNAAQRIVDGGGGGGLSGDQGMERSSDVGKVVRWGGGVGGEGEESDDQVLAVTWP